jgi:ribose/xylose/arabinose/galactoside ABC-type transport system permease subunit
VVEGSSAGRLRQKPRAGRPRQSGGMGRLAARLANYQSGGLLVALIVMGAVFTSTSGNFLTHRNLTVILLQVSIVGLAAIPQAMLVLSGYVDLSVGSVAVLAVAVFGQMAKVDHHSLAVSIAVALAAGAGWGLMNGLLISYLEFSPIIVTLGGFVGARGLSDTITHDVTQFGFGENFAYLGNGTLFSLPVPAVIFLGLFLVGAYIWYEMPVGRHLTAIGADKTSARALGVAVKRLPCVLYVFSGLAAAAGGLILTSELDGASPSIGVGLELQVLTAVLLGGVAFAGGRGSLWGVLFGILFIGVLNNGLILLNIGPYVVNLAVGVVLVAAAGADAFYQRLERIPVVTPEAETETPAGAAA